VPYRRLAGFTTASLLVFLALAVAHTWPLSTAPGRLSRNDTHDTVHHEWILAWDAHQMVRDPLHLFDTNTFYPERNTLAYSDHIIVQALMGAPLLWLGASPVLVYNVLLVLGLSLTGWTTALVVRAWTGSASSALLSGSLMAFNAFTLTRFAEIQDQHLEFFAPALWALDRLLRSPQARHAWQLASWFVLQALTCGYLLVFTALSLLAATVVRPSEWWGARNRRAVVWLGFAALVSGVALLPFLLPYLRVSRAMGLVRPLDEVALYSARLTDYLSTGGRLHFSLWSHHFFDREGLFPGVVGAGLALVAVVSGVAWRDRRARMALAFGIVAFCLSFGPAFPLYAAVSRAFPIMAGIRGASRFGQIWLAAIALLAGIGLAHVQRRLARAALAVAVMLIAGVHVEAWRAPINYRRFDGVSPIFDRLAVPETRLIACFPFPPAREAFHNVDCMLASTRFWKPLLNGYSSFIPDSYQRAAAALDAFPEGDTLAYLRGRGVTNIIVFTNKLSAPRVAHLSEHPELVLMAEDGPVRIYRLQ
jgi:hypothetical protein